MSLSDRERVLYARQLLLPEIGRGGQERLLGTAFRASADADPDALAVAVTYLTRAGMRPAADPARRPAVPDAHDVRALHAPPADAAVPDAHDVRALDTPPVDAAVPDAHDVRALHAPPADAAVPDAHDVRALHAPPVDAAVPRAADVKALSARPEHEAVASALVGALCAVETLKRALDLGEPGPQLPTFSLTAEEA